MTCQKCLAFYREVLTILVYGQVSMLSDSIRKMFLLCLFADFFLYEWPRNIIKSLFRKEIFVNTRNRC